MRSIRAESNPPFLAPNATPSTEWHASPAKSSPRGLERCCLIAALLALAGAATPVAAGPPTDGIYTGTTQSGFDVMVEVGGGVVTMWSGGHSVNMCVTVSSFTSNNCNTTGASFTCGTGVFCAPTGAPQFSIEGTFAGDTVSGTFDFRFQGPVIMIPPPCCIADNVPWSATRVSEIIFFDGFEGP